MGDKFGRGRHIDTVDIGVAHRRRCRREEYLCGPGIPGHLDNLAAGGAADDGVIHQHHVLALELQRYRVEFLAHGLFALVLAGHDEGAADVAIFHQPLAKLDAQFVRHGLGGDTAGIGNRDDDVDVQIRSQPANLLAQGLALSHPCFVDGYFVHQGIGPGEINVLENTGAQARAAGALAPVQPALHVDKHRFAGRNVADQGKAQHIQCHAFRGKHVFRTLRALARADDKWPDTQRVAKTQHPVIDHQAHGRVTAAAALVNRRNGGEDILRARAQLAQGLHLMGENVEQYLRIGIGVEVPQVVLEQLARELLGIGEVAVVCQGDAVGRVNIKRLCQGGARAARGRVAHVTDANTAAQGLHMLLAKYVAHQPLALALAETAAVAGHDSRSILAPVLEHSQRVVYIGGDFRFSDDTNQATHAGLPL